MLNKNRFFADFRVHAKFSEALYCPAPSEKQQIEVKFWIWGPITVYYNMTVPNLDFKKHSTLIWIFRWSICLDSGILKKTLTW